MNSRRTSGRNQSHVGKATRSANPLKSHVWRHAPIVSRAGSEGRGFQTVSGSRAPRAFEDREEAASSAGLAPMAARRSGGQSTA